MSELVKSCGDQLAEIIGTDTRKMIQAIKDQCFRNTQGITITDSQLLSFISIASSLKLNPLLPGMLYAFPDKKTNAIIPMIGPDGIFKLLCDNPDVDWWDTDLTFDENGTPVTCTAQIKLKSRERPLKKTIYFKEWNRPDQYGRNGWSNFPIHMFEQRALKLCARMVVHGIPFDADERQMIMEHDAIETSFTEKKQAVLPVGRFDKQIDTAPEVTQFLEQATTQTATAEQAPADAPDNSEDGIPAPSDGAEAYSAGFPMSSNPFDGDDAVAAARWKTAWEIAKYKDAKR